MTDDAARRQLRFSLVLQGFAALMMGTAAVVRILAFGMDALAAVFVALCLAILGAAWFTWRRLKDVENSSS